MWKQASAGNTLPFKSYQQHTLFTSPLLCPHPSPFPAHLPFRNLPVVKFHLMAVQIETEIKNNAYKLFFALVYIEREALEAYKEWKKYCCSWMIHAYDIPFITKL